MEAGFNGLRLRHWRIQQHDDGVLILAFDCTRTHVNTFSQETLIELDSVLERLRDDPPAALVVTSSKPNGFAAGANIGEFQEFDRKGTILDVIQRGQQAFQHLAELPCPTVAAIHGFCMGGGTELALACRYRIASRDPATRIGLPEIKLGIYPGWGGSVRLPPLVGAAAAFDLMLAGRSLSSGAAQAIGLIDQIAPPDILIEAARHLALTGCARPLKQRVLGWASRRWGVRQIVAPLLQHKLTRKLRKAHYPAPYALIETWRRSGGGDIHARLAAERRDVVHLASTSTARNLVRVFFLQERLKHLAGTETPAGGDIHHVHVIGAGIMGGDIAAWGASKGFTVTLHDQHLPSLQAAFVRAQALFNSKAKDAGKRLELAARLQTDPAGDGAAKADLVIEAIIEDPHAKRTLYTDIVPALKPDALLVSNTSSIPLDELCRGLPHPERFAGLHFFNPVARMPLVEVIRHNALDAQAGQRLMAFCAALGKLPLPVRGTPGFLVNRLLFPYLLEAARAWSEGIPAALIDHAALEFGMPMGPLELMDTVGLDVATGVAAELAPFLGLSIPAALAAPAEAGRRGKKDGQGLYAWKNGKPDKPQVSKDYQVPEDLQDRLILPLINEAVAVLHEGVVDDADLVDAGMIFGAGFAPFRGGPIHYLRQTGRDVLHARLLTLQSHHGDRFNPRAGWDSPLLLEPVE